MTAPEDRLRDLLHGDEADVGPGSFDDVRSRARRRARRARMARGGAAVVAVLALVGVAVPLLGDDEPEQQVVAEPGPTTSSIPSTTVPADEPEGIWPFATAADADDTSIELPFNSTDASATAEAFLERFAGFRADDVQGVDTPHRVRAVDVEVRRRNRTTIVSLRRLGESDRWTVVGARADGLELDGPWTGEPVRPPLAVSGRASAFEGTVLVKVLNGDDPPSEIGRAVLTGEMGLMKPFSGTVAFTPDAGGRGAVVAVTESAEDGAVEQVAAAPLRWTPALRAAVVGVGEMVAVLTTDLPDDPDLQDVVVLDASSGEIRRTLLDDIGTAEGGVLDLDVAPDRQTAFVSVSTSACGSDVTAIHEDGSTLSLGPGERVAVSPDGRRLALWVPEGCNEDARIEVRDLVTDDVVGRYDTAGTVGSLAWDGEGAVLYEERHEAEVGVRRIALDTGASELLRPTRPWISWAQVVRTPWGVAVLATNEEAAVVQLVHAEEGGGVLNDIGRDAISYAVVRDRLYWVTASGLLTTGEGVVKRDVAMVAS